MSKRLTIGMISPQRRQCGIADYTAYLLPELRNLVDIAYVTDAADFEDSMNEVDLIHVQHQYFLFGGVAPWKNRFRSFADKLKAPAVMTVHEFVEPHGDILRRTAINATNRGNFTHRAIRRLIVHTEADRDRMAKSGITRNLISLVRHGVPPAPSMVDQEAAKQALGLQGRFVVTLFGFLSRRKGHSLAIEAMRSTSDDVSLLVAGGTHPDDNTGYAGNLLEMIQAHGLSHKVKITGYLQPDGVAEVMSATDMIIAPFIESSGSGSLALAFACGKPILASGILPHYEIERESPGSLEIFSPLNAESLSKAIENQKSNSRRRLELAAAALRHAQTHSYANMAKETVQVYCDVLGRSN